MKLSKFLAVSGYPISHSLSPLIFDRFLKKEKDSNFYYSRLSVQTTRELIYMKSRLDLYGFNVTSPFKQSIDGYLDDIQNDAKKVNAVNTVLCNNTNLKGFNTDYLGVIRSLRKKGVNLKNKRILILGAGGAASSAILGLKKHSAKITVINRTEKKAVKLADKFDIDYTNYNNFENIIEKKDLLISTIPVNKFPFDLNTLPRNITLFNAYYKKNQLEQFAKSYNIKYIDGKDWLINQAIPTYNIFLGKNLDDFKINKNELEIEVKNIGFIGFMKSGKTSVGKQVAKKLNKRFIDIDELIEKRENKKISKIYEENGEKYFRKIEEEVILELDCNDCVISYGGGIIENQKIIEKLKSFSYNIWLWAHPESILKRKGLANRPLLKKSHKDIEKMIKRRFKGYFRTSDLIINTDNKDLKGVIEHAVYEADNLFG